MPIHILVVEAGRGPRALSLLPLLLAALTAVLAAASLLLLRAYRRTSFPQTGFAEAFAAAVLMMLAAMAATALVAAAR